MEGTSTPGSAPKKQHILIGTTGSVASIKLPEIVTLLQSTIENCEIKVVSTENSIHFFDPTSLGVSVLRDQDEWQMWQQRGDPVLHIELRRWADVLVIAPLDANTLGKLACGLCDNLLTCVVRAWDMKRPLLFATAMNTHMWEHPISAENVEKLKGFGYLEIPSIEKLLACGDTGFGGMAKVEDIVAQVHDCLKEAKSTEEDPKSS